jgi:hypothetical protein
MVIKFMRILAALIISSARGCDTESESGERDEEQCECPSVREVPFVES